MISLYKFSVLLYAILPLSAIFPLPDYRLPCSNKPNIDFSFYSTELDFLFDLNALLTFSPLTPASGKLNILRLLIRTCPTCLRQTACIIKAPNRKLFFWYESQKQIYLPSLKQHENKLQARLQRLLWVKVLTVTWNQTVNNLKQIILTAFLL